MSISAVHPRDFRWAALLVAASWGVGFWLLARLPAGQAVPVHWNAHGEVDRYGSPFESAFIAPLAGTLLLLLLMFLPRLDPRRGNYGDFRGAYAALTTGVAAFLLVVHGMVAAQTLGSPVDLGRWIAPLVALFFAGLGLLLPRIGPNWLAGIRTPWTLDDDEVWRATHRVGGKLFLAAGIGAAIATAVTPPPWGIGILMAAIASAVIGSAAYSYVAYRRLHP